MQDSLLRFFFVFLIIAFCTANKTHAGHIISAELSVSEIHQGNYAINFVKVRDCGSSESESDVIEVRVRAACIDTNILLHKVASEDSLVNVTPGCITGSNCNSCENNCNFSFGYEKLTYVGSIDLFELSCCEYDFIWQDCCRSLPGQTADSLLGIYLESNLNQCVSGQHSTASKAYHNQYLSCKNEMVNWNFGNMIPDEGSYDSVVYHLYNPLIDSGVFHQYSGTYSYLEPLDYSGRGTVGRNAPLPNGFHLNRYTGVLSFVPQTEETGLVGIRATAWKYGHISVEARRDLMARIIECGSGISPDVFISGIDSTQHSTIEICSREKSCFEIYAAPNQQTDDLSLFFGGLPKGMTWHVATYDNYMKATLCWEPENKFAGQTFSFSAHATADFCPHSVTENFQVYVKPSLEITGKAFVCIGDETELQVILPDTYQNSEIWWLPDSVNSSKIQVSPVETTTYIAKTESLGSCISTDTFEVKVFERPEINAGNDTSVCRGTEVLLEPEIGAPASMLSFAWLPDNYFHPLYSKSVDTSEFLIASIVDLNGCENRDTIFIEALKNLAVEAGSDFTLCENDKPFSLSGTPAGGVWVGSGLNENVFNPADAGSGEHMLIYHFPDHPECDNADSIIVTVNEVPVIEVQDQVFCHEPDGISLSINVISGDDDNLTFHWPDMQIESKSVQVNPDSSSYFVAEVVNGLACVVRDSAFVTVSLPIEFNMDSVIYFCSNEGKTTLHADPPGGKWFGQGVSGKSIYPASLGPGEFEIEYVYENMHGCKSRYIQKVEIYHLPFNISAGNDLKLCENETSLYLDGKPEGGAWYGSGVVDNRFYPSKVDSGVYNLVYEIRTDDRCVARDTKQVIVQKAPPSKFSISEKTEYCAGKTFSFEAPENYLYLWPDNSVEQEYSSNQPGDYFVIITNEYGCYDTSDVVTIHHNPKPDIHVDGNLKFCEGEFVSFELESEHHSFIWNDGIQMKKRNVYESGIYQLRAENNAGCIAFSNAYAVLKYANPESPYIRKSVDSVIAMPSIEGYTYYWELNDVLINETKVPYILTDKAGSYRFTVENNYGCRSTSVPYEINFHAFEIYPNPGKGHYAIEAEFNESASLDFSIYVFNIKGSLIYRQDEKDISGLYVHHIDITDHAKGAYLLKIVFENESIYELIVKY
jgi:hypothetical protein